MCRLTSSACSRCSSNQRDDASSALPPCSTKSAHALAMPCRRSPLSSTPMSRCAFASSDMTSLHLLDVTQPVVPGCVGLGHMAQLQGSFCMLWQCRTVQTSEHVAHMLDADGTTWRSTFQNHLHCHPHRIQPSLRDQ